MKLIVAINNKGYIGNNGELMWRSKEDFKHFKSKTLNSALIVGKVTFEQDLKGKYLKDREMFIVGKGYLSLFEAVKRAIKTEREIYVIGGASIYEQLLPLCEEIHLSIINNDKIGDRQFIIPPDYRGKVFRYYFEEEKQ
jgi:dihydrofolate reductase